MIRRQVREALVRRSHTLHQMQHERYPYMFTPRQLAALVGLVDDALAVEGSLLELGCAQGWTTVLLNRHLEDRRDVRPYLCVDTFAGFTARDVAFEREHRGKQRHAYENFADNDVERFRTTMRVNELERVDVVEHDASTMDYTPWAPVAFCLVDVDLYLPVRDSLEAVWPLMSPGGIVVVDDCDARVEKWDGALQAYREFVEAHDMPETILEDKLGLVRVPG